MAHADWIIDLGPGAGHDGGQIVFEGTPAELIAARQTVTAEHLAAYVDGAAGVRPASARSSPRQNRPRAGDEPRRIDEHRKQRGQAAARAHVRRSS
jgi:hypothetical protein